MNLLASVAETDASQETNTVNELPRAEKSAPRGTRLSDCRKERGVTDRAASGDTSASSEASSSSVETHA
jgi:hypothetical protein